MLKKSIGFLAALALLGFAVPTHADAQGATLYISGGGSFPTGDFGDYADTGWMAAGGVLFDIGTAGLAAGVDLFYGQNNHSYEGAAQDEKTSPYGAMAFLEYGFETGGKLQPYLFGGAGLLVHRYSEAGFSDSESKFGYQFGAGLGFPLGGTTSLYVEGRYMGASDTNYFAVLGGFAFGLGS